MRGVFLARGKRTAPRIGAYMRAKCYEPKLVLCSTAERTKETLELVLPALSGQPQIRYDRSLYLAELPVLLAEIRALASEASPLTWSSGTIRDWSSWR